MKLKAIALIMGALVLAGCNKQTDAAAAADAQIQAQAQPSDISEVPFNGTVENHAAISLDWAGVYEGTLPCADCAGIETKLTLNSNLTFELAETYLTDPKHSFVTTGNFEWDGIKPIVKLDDKGTPIYYFITEGAAVKYDIEGGPIENDLNYRLKQVSVFKQQH